MKTQAHELSHVAVPTPPLTTKSGPAPAAALALVNTTNFPNKLHGWEAEHVITAGEKQRGQVANSAEPRLYPKTHDKYDLAEWVNWRKPEGPNLHRKRRKKMQRRSARFSDPGKHPVAVSTL